MRPTSTLLRTCAGLALVATLAGCGTGHYLSYPPQVRGHQVEPETVAQLVPGTSTQADVLAVLGSPTMKATFDDNTWMYISEVTRPRIAATQNVLEQQVVAITFDAKGTVRAVETKGDADSRPVSIVDRTTPSPGTDVGFLQQLFGNIGRFGPGLGGNSSSSNY